MDSQKLEQENEVKVINEEKKILIQKVHAIEKEVNGLMQKIAQIEKVKEQAVHELKNEKSKNHQRLS